MPTYGMQGGAWMNQDQRDSVEGTNLADTQKPLQQRIAELEAERDNLRKFAKRQSTRIGELEGERDDYSHEIDVLKVELREAVADNATAVELVKGLDDRTCDNYDCVSGDGMPCDTCVQLNLFFKNDHPGAAMLERLAALEKRFPMLDGPSIPWWLAEKIHRCYSAFHRQGLQRIAERGGFGWNEAATLFKRYAEKFGKKALADLDAAGRGA